MLDTALDAAKSGWGVTFRFVMILVVLLGGGALLVALGGDRVIAALLGLLH